MKTTWAFQIRAESAESIDLDVYDVVGDPWGDSPSAKQVLDKLAASKNAKQINLRINSRGGSVDDGLAMYNLLNAHAAKKTVYVDGLAASIASVLAMVGDEIVMPESAMMMIHLPWGVEIGDSEQMRKMADLLDKRGSQLAGIYANRTGQKLDDVLAAMKAETWMTAEDAKAAGYATQITPSKKMAAAHVGQVLDLSEFRRVPGAAIAIAAALRSEPNSKAVPFHEYPKRDDSSWDGAAAEQRMRHWASSDGSGDAHTIDWTKYRNGFAWYDEKNSNTFGAYKLPHHDVENGELVTSRSGTIAAGDAVSGSRGGTSIPEADMAGVKTHLEKSYAQFDLKAPWQAQNSASDKTSGGANNNATPPRGAGSRKTKMTKDELKAQHPDLFAAVLADGKTEGVKEGTDKERTRVLAHLKLADSTGAKDIARKAIETGASVLDESVHADYMSAALTKRDVQNRTTDDAAAAAALDKAKVPAANAGGTPSPVDAGVDLFLAGRKMPATPAPATTAG